MFSLIFLGGISFLLALVLTPLVRDQFLRYGVVDHPDNARKHHLKAVPRIGGVPLVVSCIGSFLLLWAVRLQGGNVIEDSLAFVIRFLPGVILIFATGLADDLIGLKPWQKLAGQIAAAGAAYWVGVSVHGFGGYELSGWWRLPLTIVWLVLCTNAVNLIDGMDGLAAGVGLFAASTMLVAALLQGNFALALATMPLVGALLGFLRYNFNPATIFLGDSGSLLIGFLLGSYGVVWSQKSATILGMTAPLMALAIPLLDTGLAIVRRFLNNKPIFGADRGHIHHRLLDRGLTTRKAVLLLYSLCGAAALFSLAMSNQNLEGLVLVVFCAVSWVGIQHLGYVEMGVAGRMFMDGAFRRQLSGQIALRSHAALLAAARTPEECWTIVQNTAREFGFCGARMMLGGQLFNFRDTLVAGPIWDASLPLSESDFVEFTRPIGHPSTVVVTPYIEMLATALGPKLAEFRPAVPPLEAQRAVAQAAAGTAGALI